MSAGIIFAGLSDGDGGGELSLEDWRAEANAVCEEYEPWLSAAQASHGEIRTSEDAVALFDTAIPILREYNKILVAVGIPSERSDEVEELLDRLESQERRVLEIRQALLDRDVETYRWLIAVQAPAYEYLNAKASELGVPACDSRDTLATSA